MLSLLALPVLLVLLLLLLRNEARSCGCHVAVLGGTSLNGLIVAGVGVGCALPCVVFLAAASARR